MLPSLHHLLERRRTRWLLLVGAVALAVVGAVTVELLRIRADLEAGRDELTGIDLSTVEQRGGLAAVADRAADRLDDAADRARSSPILRVAGIVPGLRRQVDAVRDLTAAVAVIGDQGREAAAGIEQALGSGSGPEQRLDIVAAVEAELDALAARLDAIDIGAGGWLLPPLARARDDLAIELADARSDVARGQRLTGALAGFLGGPRRYLILGGNNAEMRAVGIPTTSGLATVADGAIDVGEFSAATDTIEIPEPGVPVPLEYETLYGWLNGDRGYRTTLATANWPVAAQIAADITARNQYGEIDGIIYVDTVTLAKLLLVIGPVEVDGVEYRADNVLPELLYRNYLRYQTVEDNPERKALQSEVAQAIFDAINERDFPLLELAGLLSDMARGRHLLAWSADEAENELWAAFGADGRLRSDGLGLVSEELGASKLDYFTHLEVDVDAEIVGDDERRVTMRVTIVNPEHPRTSPYIDGGGMYADPGEYGSFLAAYLPAGVHEVTSETGFTHYGPDGPMFVAATIVRVPEGEDLTVEIQFSLSAGREVVTVMPAARLLPTLWRFGGEERYDELPFEIDLSDLD